MTKRRKKNTITSKSPVPEDLILEVLRILEAKSLQRFRCVSKSWNSIISDPSFARLHLKRCSRLLLYDYSDKQFFRTTDYETLKTGSSIEACGRRSLPFKLTSNLRIWGYCNGIICFGDCLKDNVSLWNPTTGEVYSLPKPLDRGQGWDARFGFGWDKSVNDYKVVRMLFSSSVRTKVELLALKSKTWVKTVADIGLYLSFERNKMIYCNGGLHWLASSYSGSGSYRVARFDLADEKLQKLLLPPRIVLCQTESIGVLGDNLCFCSWSYDLFSGWLDVWVMKEYEVESPWTKLMTVKDGYIQRYVPLSVTTDGGIIGIANGSVLVKSNPNSGLSTKLIEERLDRDDISCNKCCEAVVYEETLVPIGGVVQQTHPHRGVEELARLLTEKEDD